MNSIEIAELKRHLEISDLTMARIVEDLIHILVQRGSIKYSDFCDESRNKLKEREELRGELRKLVKKSRGEACHKELTPQERRPGRGARSNGGETALPTRERKTS